MTHVTSSRHILYILGQTAGPEALSLIPKKEPGETLSVILLEDAACIAGVPADHVYVLADHMASSELPAACRTVSSQEMVEMIFQVDRVVVL